MHEPNLAIVPRIPIRKESAEYHLFSKINQVLEKLVLAMMRSYFWYPALA